MPTYPPKHEQVTNYTEQPVVIVSKENTCQIWAGAKTLYSGIWGSGPGCGCSNVTNISGYNYLSGESDVSPISHSGWGLIRVPELAEVHAAIIVPKSPCIQAAPDYCGGNQSGYAKSGIGGISGNVMLVHYCDTCYASGAWLADGICWRSGTSFVSGIVDVFAFGSKY